MEEETGFQVLHVPEHWALRETYHGPLYVLVAPPPPNGGWPQSSWASLSLVNQGLKHLDAEQFFFHFSLPLHHLFHSLSLSFCASLCLFGSRQRLEIPALFVRTSFTEPPPASMDRPARSLVLIKELSISIPYFPSCLPPPPSFSTLIPCLTP